MTRPLDDEYLAWLYARIGLVNKTRPSLLHWGLLRLLSEREFVFLIPNDDNRVEDGRYIRYEFLDETRMSGIVDPQQFGPGCSVLEMLVSVSQHLAFEADRDVNYWFWEMLNNLDLIKYNDRQFVPNDVDEIIHILNYRDYSPDGRGGLFPMYHATADQRRVEIWTQMQHYILQQL